MQLATATSTPFVMYSSHRFVSRLWPYRSAATRIPTASPSSMGAWSVYKYSSRARKHSKLMSSTLI